METTYLDDGSAWSGEPAQIAFYMVDAAGISHLHRKEVYSYHVEDHVKRVEKRSTANGMTRLEVTETWQADAENPHARGRARMTQEVNGIQTWYDYVPATQYGALYAVIAETRSGGELVAGQSFRSIRHVTAHSQWREDFLQ